MNLKEGLRDVSRSALVLTCVLGQLSWRQILSMLDVEARPCSAAVSVRMQ